MEKTPCRECGALILPETAQSTGGLCMACKQGIRKDIEASKSYYKNRKSDPTFLLWGALCKKFDETRYEKFLPEEIQYYSINLLSNEVHRGGFEAYFFNSSGDGYALASDSLLALEENEFLRILRSAAVILFGDSEPPVDTDERRRKILLLSEIDREELYRLDKEFWNQNEKLEVRLQQLAIAGDLYGLNNI